MPYTKRNSLRRAVMLAGVALATLATTPAFAQDADAEAPAEAQDGFEELGGAIVVTARKREENLQETPISISAFSSEGLAAISTSLRRSSPTGAAGSGWPSTFSMPAGR